MHFERLRGNRSRALKDMFDDPVIIEFWTGETYGGLMDEYYYSGGGIVPLVSCKLLDDANQRWIDHAIMIEIDGKTRRDSMPSFNLSAIKTIWVLTKNLRDKYSVEDALQLYIDPHFQPDVGVECPWRGHDDGEHSNDCEAGIHEALTLLYAIAMSNDKNDEEDQTQVGDAFRRMRRRLVRAGVRIP